MNVAFIFARGGSKGVPGKNIKEISGKPLIAHTIETALNCQLIDRLIVSTDSEEIAAVAKQFGADVPFIRPSDLASDTAAEILSWKHAIKYLIENDGYDQEKDTFISLPATSPLRSVEDIENCINKFLMSEADLTLCVTKAARHPSFNMLKEKQDGYYELVMKLNDISRRQDAPKVFDITTVCYVAKPSYILTTEALLDGKVSASIVPEERAIDIDTELDFKFAEFLLNEKQ